MLRRPNRASWNEESAGRPSPLAQLLASPRPLPAPHPEQGFVGSRHDLPGMIGYGKMQQKPLEGSMFTGAQTPNPQTSLAHPQAPQMPTFSQANSHAGGVAASLAALGLLTGTPHGGGATPTLPPPPAPPVSTVVPPPVQPTMTTGIRQPDFGAGPADRVSSLVHQPDLIAGPANRTSFTPDPSRQPAIGAGPADRTGIAGALSQLLTSIGKRGVYNV